MSSTKQKELVFFFKPCDKLQQQPQQQQNDHHPIEEIQSATSDSMPEIAMNYQPNQSFMVNKNVSSNTIGLKSARVWTIYVWKIQ